MKKTILLLSVILLSTVACKKEEPEPNDPTPTATACNDFSTSIVGAWTIGAHQFDEGSGWVTSSQTGTMTFMSNGTYTHSDFTYAWHCEPGANEPDSGIWSYDSNSGQITLVSTKSQTDIQYGGTHSNAVVTADIISCMTNEVIFQYPGPNCTNQSIKITLVK